MITCALVRIVPSRLTTKPEPCASEVPTYVNTVTTPGDRAAKMRAGEKDEPPSGTAAERAAASAPAADGPAGRRTTTVWVVEPPTSPVTRPIPSAAAAPRPASRRASNTTRTADAL